MENTYRLELWLGEADNNPMHTFAVDIDYEYTPPSRGTRDRYGLQMEPDEGADVEVTGITVRNEDGTAPPLVVQTFVREIVEKRLPSMIDTLIEEGNEAYAEGAAIRADMRAQALAERDMEDRA